MIGLNREESICQNLWEYYISSNSVVHENVQVATFLTTINFHGQLGELARTYKQQQHHPPVKPWCVP